MMMNVYAVGEKSVFNARNIISVILRCVLIIIFFPWTVYVNFKWKYQQDKFCRILSVSDSSIMHIKI